MENTATVISRRNISLFILFRLCFNSRFYYPVFAVLFLDFGLSIGQFAVLNTVWALAIVLLEVPSGALADRFGRRRLVVFAAICMILEMAVLVFAPRTWSAGSLFLLFLFNRILSGAAEAAASGADEALAYDSLAHDGKQWQWPDVLARLMRFQAAAFFVAMVTGSLLYDGLLGRLEGLPLEFVPKEWWMRSPVFFTMILAFMALAAALAMREPPLVRRCALETTGAPGPWQATLATGTWIVGHRVVLLILLATMVIDSMVRLFLTINSSYYRLIEIPEAAFGVIGSAMALVGMLVPSLAKRLHSKVSMEHNFFILCGMTLFGLGGLALAIPVWGVLFALPLGAAIYMLGFLVSAYLNELVDSERRATTLSFRGLATNLAYGFVGLLFAALVRVLRDGSDSSEETALARALIWLPAWFGITMLALVLFARKYGVKLPSRRRVSPDSDQSVGR